MARAGRRRPRADRRSPGRPACARLAAGVRRSWRWPPSCSPATCSAPTWAFNPAIPVEHAEQPSSGGASLPGGAAAESLRRAQSPRHRAAAPAQPGDALRPLRRTRLRLPGGAPLRRLLARHGGHAGRLHPAHRARASRPRSRCAALSLLSVTDVLQDPSDPAAEPPRPAAWPTTAPTRASTATPTHCRAPSWWAGSAWSTARRRRWRRSTAPGFDARREAITEEPPAGPARRRPRGRPGRARLVRYDDEARRRGGRRRARPALLVLTDVHFPGWKATVDDEPAEIEQVDYLLRGVQLPAGAHRVEFRYEPASWRIGWIVSLLALVVLVGRGPGRPAAPKGRRELARAALAVRCDCHALRGAGAAAGQDPLQRRRALVRASLGGRQAGRARCGRATRSSGDWPRYLQPFLRETAVARCPTCRCGTRTSWAVTRSRPTPSRRCSGPTPCSPTCFRSGRPWAGSRCSSSGWRRSERSCSLARWGCASPARCSPGWSSRST